MRSALYTSTLTPTDVGILIGLRCSAHVGNVFITGYSDPKDNSSQHLNKISSSTHRKFTPTSIDNSMKTF